jgi:hypothetical protein
VTKKRKTTRGEVSAAALQAAKLEADERLRRRDNNALRSRYVAELTTIEQMLDDENHPLWRALALLLVPKATADPEQSFSDVIDRLIRELRTPVRDALTFTRGCLVIEPVVDTFGGKKQARPGESAKTTLTRVLLESGASSYEAARAAGGHKADVHSAALPEAEVRGARRLQAAVRKEAVESHSKLVDTVIAHRPVLVGPVTENLQDAFLGMVENAVRAEEKRQATIAKNIDGQRRKSGGARRK